MTAGAGRDVVFIHVPRTAGTSIRHALRMGTGVLHTPARQLRRELGAARWSTAFTFAFVRNPWTRALSLYRKLRPSGSPADFRGWAARGFPAPERDGICVSAPMTELLMDSHQMLVEWVGRYENLERQWPELRARLEVGWPYSLPDRLPHVNSCRPCAPLGWYDRETADRVADHYCRDLSYFSYSEPPGLTRASVET